MNVSLYIEMNEWTHLRWFRCFYRLLSSSLIMGGGVLDWRPLGGRHGVRGHNGVYFTRRGSLRWTDLDGGCSRSIWYTLFNRTGWLSSSKGADTAGFYRAFLDVRFTVLLWLLESLPLWSWGCCWRVLCLRWWRRCFRTGNNFSFSWLGKLKRRWGAGYRILGFWLDTGYWRGCGLDSRLWRSWCSSWWSNSTVTVTSAFWNGQMTGSWHWMDMCSDDCCWRGAGVGL